jgi:hypothetical protein
MNLLECLAESLGETIEEHADPTKIWRSLSLAERRNLAAGHNDPTAKVVGVYDVSGGFQHQTLRTEVDNHISGTIVIPATAFVEPAKPDKKKVLTMNSVEIAGTQLLHLENDGSVGYRLPAFLPTGSFLLTARIVNIHRRQGPLLLSIESVPGLSTMNSSNLEVPYTGGEWRTTAPLEVKLVPGAIMRISREADSHGLTIKEFSLQPVCVEASRDVD